MAQDKPNLVFLMETKNKETVVERVRKCLQFQSSVIINPVGIAGGLALFWNDEVTVDVEDSSGEIIDVICRDLSSGVAMGISFLHASTTFRRGSFCGSCCAQSIHKTTYHGFA